MSAQLQKRCDAITVRNQQVSPFFRVLPGEIRNIIYHLVIAGAVAQEDHLKCTDDSCEECSSRALSWKFMADKHPGRFTGLLAASRQVHAETQHLHFKLNEFTIKFKEMGKTIGRMIPMQRNLLVTLRLSLAADKCHSVDLPRQDLSKIEMLELAFADLSSLRGLNHVVIVGHRQEEDKVSMKDVAKVIKASFGARTTPLQITFE